MSSTGKAMEYLEGMKRPSKKEIREAVEKLREKKENSTDIEQSNEKADSKGFKSQRIRKKGI